MGRFDARTRPGAAVTSWGYRGAAHVRLLNTEDYRGVVYYLGSALGTSITFTNPHTSALTVIWSTQLNTNYGDTRPTDRGASSLPFISSLVANSWVGIDFGAGRGVDPTHVAVRQRGDTTGQFHGTLDVRASNNYSDWTVLGSIASPTQSMDAWNYAAVTGGTKWRYLIFEHATTDSSGTNYLVVGELEIFGTYT